MISCKKSEENVWALISREKNPKDPNINWFPLHLWSNAISINYMMKEEKGDWRADYVHSRSGLFQRIFSTESHIFAFQKMDKQRATKKGSERIFSSVDSLIKAQTYEMASLPERKRDDRCFYSFNLLVVVDAPLINVRLEAEIKANKISDDRYIANYIVNGSETCARIHFVQYDALDSVLRQYNNLQEHSADFFARMRNRFFDGVMQDHRRRGALQEMFTSALRSSVYFALTGSNFHIGYADLSLSLWWNKEKKIALIQVYDEKGIIEAKNNDGSVMAKLNNDARLMKKTGKIFSQLYKYEGEFQFEPGYIYEPGYI
jgi:hypothetical protein